LSPKEISNKDNKVSSECDSSGSFILTFLIYDGIKYDGNLLYSDGSKKYVDV
jgi:hypothetical protein